VSSALTISGLDRETAKKYAYFAEELYEYNEGSPQLKTVLEDAKSTMKSLKEQRGTPPRRALGAMLRR
jgi:hypothetical protein